MRLRSLRARAWIASALAIIAIAALGASMLIRLSSILQQQDHHYNATTVTQVALRELQVEIMRLEAGLVGLAATPSPLMVRRFQREMNEIEGHVALVLGDIQRVDPARSAAARAVEMRFADWAGIKQDMLGALERGDAVTAYTLGKTEGRGLTADMRRMLEQMVVSAGRDGQAERREIEQRIAGLVWEHLLILFVSLLAAGGSAYFIDRVILGPTRQISEAIGRVANGGLDQTIPHAEREDEIGEIARATQVFLDHAIAVRNSAFSLVTELPTRPQFCEHLEIFKMDPAHRQRNAAVLFVDIDRFGEINDAFGRKVGDEVLRHVARTLRGVIRIGDFIAHDGADRFVLLLLDRIDYEAAETVARQVINVLAEPVTVAGQTLSLSCCIGVAGYNQSLTAEEILHHAENALTEARSVGQGAVAVYTQEMDTRLRLRRETLQGLKFALKQDEIMPFYQPQIDARTGELRGLEALVRWNHPEQGVLSPWQFLGIAEEAGLVPAITDSMIAQSLAQMAKWRRLGLYSERVSLNFSASDLRRADFADRLALQTELAGLQPDNVCVEVLESAMIQDADDPVSRTLKRLRGVGFPIELDDFGTGHAAVSTLSMIELSGVKIDRSFVSRLHTQPERQKVVRAMLLMAQAMGVHTIAEGVESTRERAFLAAYGCDIVQGFSIAKPMSGYDTTTWLETYCPNPLDETSVREAAMV